MPHLQSQLTLVRETSAEDIAVVTNTLAHAGVPSALWGVTAAVHYGGELCPLVRTLGIHAAGITNTRSSGHRTRRE